MFPNLSISAVAKTTSVKLTEKQLNTLEKISGLKFINETEVKMLEEDVHLANKIFKRNAEAVEPLFSMTEESINCPLREDQYVKTDRKKIFGNMDKTLEGFFLSPTVRSKE
uniref:Aspartyl-tRNA synthetase n=1 Tax=Bursaphelenchus xylophilus TaxID=6326 RepID=A0A1I7RY94_BURXY